jgi:hypothetical protein
MNIYRTDFDNVNNEAKIKYIITILIQYKYYFFNYIKKDYITKQFEKEENNNKY